jgi:hypothetical protein
MLAARDAKVAARVAKRVALRTEGFFKAIYVYRNPASNEWCRIYEDDKYQSTMIRLG